MITTIEDTLLIGDWQDAKRWRELNTSNIVKIVTVAFDAPFKGDWVFPLVDGPSDSNNQLALSLAIHCVWNLQMNHTPTLVHCVSGVSRSSAVIIGYLMKKYKIDYDDALKILESKRPIAKIVPALEDLLRRTVI